MADRIATVSRALNGVVSVGEARAALRQAGQELDYGFLLVPGLSFLTSPTETEASDTLIMLKGVLASEERLIAAQAATDPIEMATWARQRRQVERAYVEVSGIEGVAAAVSRIDVGQILVDSIKGAPKVLGNAVGAVVGGVGETAGKLGGGLLSGLGLWGFLLIAVVLGVVVLGKVR